jgi:RHS repeat-associated protein
MRTQRTSGSTTYNYTYDDSTLLKMTVGSNTLIFAYGANGHPMTVKYNGVDYYYVTNASGDVIGILNSSGAEVVFYTYDAWGNILSISGSMASTLGAHNPFRYRSYVYDRETGLYYLQSRYYSPQFCRFINADGVMPATASDTLGYNLFIYCFSNPVNMTDSNGNWPRLIEEIGSRLSHAIRIIGRIAVSPFKAMAIEVGAGIGIGANASVNISGVPVKAGAVVAITDSVLYENTRFDIQNKTSASIGVNIAETFDFSHTSGHQHSYFDKNCTCNFMTSTFGEKSQCTANHAFASNSATLDFSCEAYLLFGFSLSFSIDLTAWNNELIDIYFDSLSYGR